MSITEVSENERGFYFSHNILVLFFFFFFTGFINVGEGVEFGTERKEG